MSSTNVHSNNLHIVGGYIIPKEPDESLEMPPQSAGKGPSKADTMEGITIEVRTNNVIKDGKQVIGRITSDGKVLSGKKDRVSKALQQIEGKEDNSR